MYADDTNIFLSHQSINTLECTLNIEMEKLVKWMQVNRLSLNVKKTKAIFFSNNPTVNGVSVTIGGTEVEFVDKIKFLGVIIDSKLQWRDHIDFITNKLAKIAGQFSKIKGKICRKTFVTLYYTFVYPLLIYGNIVWGKAAKVHLNKIHLMQKRIIRIIFNAKYLDHTEPLFQTASVLNVFQLYVYNVCIFMYLMRKGTFENMFDSLFSKNLDFHSHLTRHNFNYVMPYCRTVLRQRTIAYTGAYYFNHVNDIINDVFDKHSLSAFKRNMRNVILENKVDAM